MKKLILVLSLYCSVAIAKSTKETFETACNGAYLLTISDIMNPNKEDYSKFRIKAEDLCEKLVMMIEKKNGFKDMDNPGQRGCRSAMVFVPNTENEELRSKQIDRLIEQYCK